MATKRHTKNKRIRHDTLKSQINPAGLIEVENERSKVFEEKEEKADHQEHSGPRHEIFRGINPAFVLSKIQRKYAGQHYDEEISGEAPANSQANIFISLLEEYEISADQAAVSSKKTIKGDHVIQSDEQRGLVFMETLPGKLGETPDPDFAIPRNTRKRLKAIPLVDATPEEYLERMVTINQEFNTHWYVAGASVMDGELVVNTTFPMAREKKISENDPEKFLYSKGFFPVEGLKNTFYSSAKDLLIVLSAVRQTPSSIRTLMPPTDFLVTRPSLNLKRHFGLVSDDLIESLVVQDPHSTPDLDTLNKAYDDLEAKIQKKVKRPDLPCSIQQALMYLTDNPDVQIDTVVSAFKTFLAVAQTPEEREIENERIKGLTSEIEEMKFREFDRAGTGFPPSRNHPCKLAAKENDLKKAKEIRESRDGFRPGNEIHPELEWMASIRWHRYSRAKIAVDVPTMMELMGGGFRDFWKTHYKSFQTRSQLKSTAKDRLSKTREKVAKKGAPSRDHPKWLKLTEEFCAYALGKQCGDYNHMLALRKEFLNSMKMDPRTKAGKANFFGTLINLLSQPKEQMNYDEAVTILINQEIKNVNSFTLEKCAEIIKKAL